MRTIGILWNSMDAFLEEAINDIQTFASVTDVISIDFKDKFSDFISKIYPYKGEEKWKLEYKISHMFNQYANNKINIIFMNIDNENKIFVPRKKLYIYEDVEKLKMYIREKYRNKINNYAYDNIYHMTDDEDEYKITIELIINYILFYFSSDKITINLDELMYYKKNFLEKNYKNGKRNKLTLCDDKLIYKEGKVNSFESEAEVFTFYFLKKLGIESAECYMSNYLGNKGIITKNFIKEGQFFCDGTHIIDLYLNYLETGKLSYSQEIKHDIEEITRFNNLDDLSNIFEILEYLTEIKFFSLIDELKKMYSIDMILLQSDRNSNNWGILYNNATSEVKLSPLFDNSNIFGFNKPDKIKEMINLKNSNKEFILSLYKDNFTLLRLHRDDNIFDSKLNMIYAVDDYEVISYLKKIIDEIESYGLDKLINDVFLESGIVSSEFKELIFKSLNISIVHLKSAFNAKKKKFMK